MNLNKWIKGCSLQAVILLLISPFFFQNLYSEDSVNILLLNSYHKGYLWTDEITRGVEDGLRLDDVSLHIEYLDSKRIYNTSYFNALYAILENKLEVIQYDAVITSDNNAFNYYREYGMNILGDIPLVFCGLNYVQEEDLVGLTNATGVNEKADLKKNLQLIESIHKDIETILVIADDTTTGLKIQEEINRIIEVRPSEALRLEVIHTISLEDLKEKVRSLDSTYIVYLTVFFRDSLGEFFEYDEAVNQISEASAVPVYGTWDFHLNEGITGGHLVDGYSQGLAASGMVLEILGGEPVQSIPIIYDTPTTLKFNYLQLERFGIDSRKLPPGSLIINRTESFFFHYKNQILVTIFVFVLFFLAFVGIFFGYIKSLAAEKKIRFHEENLRTTLYSIGDGVISTDLNQNVVRMNPVAEVLTGWSKEEADSRSINDVFKIFHVENRQALENPIAKVMETGKIDGLPRHSLLIARDGREFKISDSAAPIQDSEGFITGVVLVFRNVSEEYRVQQQLINERNYAKRIINNAPSMICGLDSHGTAVFINPVIEKITGYEEDEIIGQNFWELLYPDNEFHQVKKLLLESREGVVVDFEMTLTCKNDNKKNIVWNSFSRKDDEGNIIGFLGFGYDITEQKKIKEDLIISKKRLRTIIDLVPSSIFVKDGDGTFLAINKATSKSLGVNIRELIGSRIQDVYPYPKMAEAMLEQDQMVLEKGISVEVAEENYANSTGEILWQKVVKIPCPEDLFGVPAVLGIATDISDLKAAEKRLFETNKELVKHKNNLEELVADRTMELQISLDHLQEAQRKLVESEKMAALGELVAGVAHEVNTPVGIGVTAASYLEDSVEEFQVLYDSGHVTRSGLEKFLQLCRKSSSMILFNMNRAADLINSFKQVAVDQSSQERRLFKIRQYIEEILLSLHAQLRKTPYEIKLSCPEELEVDSYPGALSQIITNLIMNSLHHGFEGLNEGSITIDIRKSENSVLIIYGDTGRGIPDDHLDKIFDPFFTTKRGTGGSGLGMNIVYNLVTQTLGGQINCTSKIGQGTWFEIEFPAFVS